MKLVWNAIVRNESAIIDRCVKSLLPYIDGAVIVDTGSTDGTPEKLKELFAAAGKPIEISPAPFINFAQARNEALRCARISRMEWDYLLLADADMALKVHKPNWINGAKGLSYDLRQTAGALTYTNRRLVSRRADGIYRCPTHEYIDVPSDGLLDGAEFIDYADGANRPEKLGRDIAILEDFLKTETNQGLIERAHFYLAGSYFDLGNWKKAAEHYKIRVGLSGFDEEVWNAQLRYAQCLEKMGDYQGFVWEALQAYWRRPHRAEVLYELAKFFRDRGENHASLLFSEAGLTLPHAKDDLLFVNDWIYKTGLKEEFAICAYYDKPRRERGAKICNELALKGSEQARSNMFWYLKPLVEHVPSFKPTRIDFSTPPEGYVATNPSFINDNGQLTGIVRTVNYTITPEGRYAIRGADDTYNSSNPIDTRNYLVRFSDEMNSLSAVELLLPTNWPKPKFDLVRGFEDSRLFKWNDELWTISTVRELTTEGWCEQVLAPVTPSGYGQYWEVIRPKERRHEKNWMPWIKNGRLDFVYRLGSILDVGGNLVGEHDYGIDVSHISGGSQVVEADGVHIALVHEAKTIPGRINRYYQHRFVAFDPVGKVLKLSQPFVFHDKQIEFAAGLAYFSKNHKLVVSYGVRDCEAWLAEMDVTEVLDFIDGS